MEIRSKSSNIRQGCLWETAYRSREKLLPLGIKWLYSMATAEWWRSVFENLSWRVKHSKSMFRTLSIQIRLHPDRTTTVSSYTRTVKSSEFLSVCPNRHSWWGRMSPPTPSLAREAGGLKREWLRRDNLACCLDGRWYFWRSPRQFLSHHHQPKVDPCLMICLCAICYEMDEVKWHRTQQLIKLSFLLMRLHFSLCLETITRYICGCWC